jgi:hypothetical protein
MKSIHRDLVKIRALIEAIKAAKLVFCTEQLVPTKSPAVRLPDGRGGLRNRRYLRLCARTERSTPSAWVNLVSQGGYQASDLEH